MPKRKEYVHDGYHEECFLCRHKFPLGPHRYEGRKIVPWGIYLCDGCRKSNQDGIVPGTRHHLKQYLDENKKPYALNSKGFIIIPE